MAHRLEPEFPVVLHRRASPGAASLVALASDLHNSLHRRHIPGPFLLGGHSFGALVLRQFAATFPDETAGLVFVDGLPLFTRFPRRRLWQARGAARFGWLLAQTGFLRPLLPLARRHIRGAAWAFQELEKLTPAQQSAIVAEWCTPVFYRHLADLLSALPANLAAARALVLPPHLPVISLHSDYPDPYGRRVPHAGHWIHVDQPDVVAAAFRELGEHPRLLSTTTQK